MQVLVIKIDLMKRNNVRVIYRSENHQFLYELLFTPLFLLNFLASHALHRELRKYVLRRPFTPMDCFLRNSNRAIWAGSHSLFKRVDESDVFTGDLIQQTMLLPVVLLELFGRRLRHVLPQRIFRWSVPWLILDAQVVWIGDKRDLTNEFIVLRVDARRGTWVTNVWVGGDGRVLVGFFHNDVGGVKLDYRGAFVVKLPFVHGLGQIRVKLCVFFLRAWAEWVVFRFWVTLAILSIDMHGLLSRLLLVEVISVIRFPLFHGVQVCFVGEEPLVFFLIHTAVNRVSVSLIRDCDVVKAYLF